MSSATTFTLTTTARSDGEATRAIETHARQGFGSIDPAAIARLVLDMTANERFDLAVGLAAVDALRRRRAFALRDGLAVSSRPLSGKIRGLYATARVESSERSEARARPYVTLLEGVRPIAGSCDCPDFTRNGLGACKHLLVVLEAVFSDPRRLARALEEGDAATPPLRLTWDPRFSLTGKVDRLTGLRFEEPVEYARGRRTFSAWRTLFEGERPDPRYLSELDDRRAFVAAVRRAFTARGRARPEIEATPAAQAVVGEEAERLERRRRFEGVASDALPHLATLQRALYPFQRTGVERLLRAGRLLLADDMGLGKTTQAIAACHALFAAKKVRRGIVVTPSSAKEQWLREWKATTELDAEIVDGGGRARKRTYEAFRSGFLIMSYEQLVRDVEQVRKLSPEIVVIDEAQRIKNYATKSAESVKRLTPEYRFVLSGAPMETRLEELASLLDWVDDLALAPKWRLEPWHMIRDTHVAGAGNAEGAKNLDVLRARLESCVLRRSRADVLGELPEKVETRVPIEMTPQQREKHDALDPPIRQLVKVSEKRPLAQAEFARLMQLFTKQRIVSNGIGQLDFESIWPAYAHARPEEALIDALSSPKLAELRRVASDIVVTQSRKLVVFSQWRRMLKLAEWSLRDILESAGLRAVFFTGAEKPATRAKNVAAFHDDRAVAVMFLTDAGSAGLELDRAASACVHLELPWNPAVLDQRVSRVFRLGQKHPVDVFRFVSEHGIEARIAELAGSKRAFFSELFDGSSDVLRFETGASLPAGLARLVAPSEGLDSDGSSGSDADEIDIVADTVDGFTVADEIPPPPPTLRSPVSVAPAFVDRQGSEPASMPTFDIAGVHIEATADGGIRIEATAEAARTLAGLFEGFAKLIASATPPRRDD